MTSAASITARAARLCGVSAVIAVVGFSAAQAACSQWDVGGTWAIRQTNGYTPKFTLRQTATDLHGEAEYTVVTEACRQTATCRPTRGSADGTIMGNSFVLNVYWSNGTIGVYRGDVGAQGRIEGTTYDR